MESAFYNEFPKLSKQDWLDKIQKDLKGANPEDYYQTLANEWELSPFLTRTDIEGPTTIQKYYTSPLVGQTFDAKDPSLTDNIMSALQAGLQSPFIKNLEDIASLTEDLKEVNWEMIHPVFELNHSIKISSLQEEIPSLQKAWIKGEIKKDHKSPGEHIKSTHFSLEYEPKEKIPEQLAGFLLEILKILDKTAEKDVVSALQSCWLEMEQGPHFHFEIAKLRAVRLLWRFFTGHYAEKEIPLPIVAKIGPAVDQKDPYRNMIAFTSSSLYAMVGGADIVNIEPLGTNGTELPENFQRRISRNIPLIAQLESFVSKVMDPVGGSYVFEKLSQDLSHLSWQIFLKKQGALQADSG